MAVFDDCFFTRSTVPTANCFALVRFIIKLIVSTVDHMIVENHWQHKKDVLMNDDLIGLSCRIQYWRTTNKDVETFKWIFSLFPVKLN